MNNDQRRPVMRPVAPKLRRDHVAEHFAADRLPRMGQHGLEPKRGRPKGMPGTK